ncbi:hypothetical protein HOU02_gp190 [Caulobacter phage CcrBL9]|uniref:Uncharacterized protein n=1 Tax=Caulobacter phage CcrBL9 TaxID=2283270 RepID=A0A385EES9_9CAUD|nr:hypothetical protein HOU02_gp190 [Caulobacter phage CcrBL9]AXQ69535.1 hypothetical protein CcrBL9_gp511 [Caulobacter phage CcrBL9]
MAYFNDRDWQMAGLMLALGMVTLFAIIGALIAAGLALPFMLWWHDFSVLPTFLAVGAGAGVVFTGVALRPWDMLA